MCHNYNNYKKMKKLKSCLVIFSVLGIVACNNQGLKKTSSGLLYKIIPEGSGANVKVGEFLKMSFVQKVRDSILYTSDSLMPAYIRVDSAGHNYTFTEILPFLRKGDSAVVVLLADSIERKSGQKLPPFIKKRDKIILSLKILDVFPNMELTNKDRALAMAKKNEQETKEIEDYLASNHITATKTAKGTYVTVDSVGNGPAVDSGKQVSVRYTGKVFPTGKVFESNMTGPGTEPIKFVVGQRQIIQGWDDGLRLFKKGGKGTLYIPAFLAYDAQPGPSRKQYENLIFDITVVDVTDAPKKSDSPLSMNGIKPKVPVKPQPAAGKK
jgi:FKBP-type peptidyl-prolyl cis-trans isomerase FkpA